MANGKGQRATVRVYVHAWALKGERYIGGNYDRYWSQETAHKRFMKGIATRVKRGPEDCADFQFHVDVSSEWSENEIDNLISGDLQAMCGHARARHVGANVLAYWREHDMDMGDSTNPAEGEYE